MGVTTARLTIKNPFKPKPSQTAEFMVDSGAHYTVLPQSLVKKLGLKPSYEQRFSLADGKVIQRSVGSALIKFEERELAVPVVLGEVGDGPLLGITTLEAFGLMLDPFKRQIYPSKLLLG